MEFGKKKKKKKKKNNGVAPEMIWWAANELKVRVGPQDAHPSSS
jgi:hypothetical protein